MSINFVKKAAFCAGVLSLCLGIAGCYQTPAVHETEPPPRIYTEEDLDSIVLTVDKETVIAGTGDIITMSAVGLAEDGTEIPDLPITYHASGRDLSGPYFPPVEKGYANLYACVGNLRSNVIEVQVTDVAVQSIDFSLASVHYLPNEQVKFNVHGNTDQGRTKLQQTSICLNGETKRFTVYNKLEPGIYEAYAIFGDLQSPVRVFSVNKRVLYTLSLRTNKTEVTPGETIHLTPTAKRYNGRDLPEGDTPKIMLCGVGEVGQDYTFEEEGTYSFYLEHEGHVSNTVVVHVQKTLSEQDENIYGGFPSDIPVIVLDTNGREIGNRKAINCTVRVYGNKGEERVETGDLPDIVTAGTVKVRGQSSMGFPKKQYSLHTQKEDGSNNNLKLLGLPRENDWVLNGSYADKSLIRNGLVQDMMADVMDYAPRTKYCSLYLKRDNGSLNYIGVYTLIEAIKIDKNRVDIEKLGPDDKEEPEVTGGYIVSFDKRHGHENVLDTKLGHITIVKPSPDVITDEQDRYIKKYLQKFSNTLKTDKRSDPVDGLTAYIDPESVAAPLLLTELVRNIDGFAISTYFYKDRDGLLKYGPSWDYDLTFGNGDYNDAAETDGWYVVGYSSFSRNMMRDDNFEQLMITTWRELRKDTLSDENLNRYFDEHLAAVGEEAIARSCARWPDHWNGSYVWPNYNHGEHFTESHAEEIAHMRAFVLARAAWMDEHIEELDN